MTQWTALCGSRFWRLWWGLWLLLVTIADAIHGLKQNVDNHRRTMQIWIDTWLEDRANGLGVY